MNSGTLPLCVDLDGTLIRTDLLFESLIALIKKNPLCLFLLPVWLLKGRASLKARIAGRVDLDMAVIPYQQEFLAYLARENLAKRPLYLITASNDRYAQAVARHLNLFEKAWGSDNRVNLKGHQKLELIRQHLGNEDFVYAGDTRADTPLWRAARGAVLVNATERLVRRMSLITSVEAVFDDRKPRLWTLVRALRLHQWTKNLLVFVPLAMSHNLSSFPMAWSAMLGFWAFGFAASFGYLINDLFDLEADRHHPRKSQRPFASGDLPLTTGLLLLPFIFGASILLASSLPMPFRWTLVTYLLLTLSYSFWLKRVVLLDVVLLAGLYTLRIIAGGTAIGIQLTFWLLAFSVFLFISLAMIKRYTELHNVRELGIGQAQGRGYHSNDLELLAVLGGASGYIAVLVLALYINSDVVVVLYSHPAVLWLVCPMLLYWISRIWLLAHRGELPDDPIVFASRDKLSYILGLAVAVILLAAR